MRTVVFLVMCVLLLASFATAFIGSTAIRRSMRLNEVLGKAELLELLKEKTELTKKDIEIVLSALTATVHDEVLTKGNEIRLRDLGTFKQKVTAARAGRNPRTGETIQISGATTVSFSVSSALKKKDGEAAKPEK